MMYIDPTVVENAVSPPLHIPDGFMSAPVAAVGWVMTIIAVAFAARMADRQLDARAVPLMGVMAAFIFAAQMMNFPVAGGTSGHLVGGALAVLLLGPWAGIIVVAAVVALQAVLFQDGGIAVMGLNILNMSVLSALSAWLIVSVGKPLMKNRGGMLAVTFVAAWVSVMVAALATTLQLAISDTSPLDVALPAMMSVHALIGIGEGLVTAAALGFVVATRPDLVNRPVAVEG